MRFVFLAVLALSLQRSGCSQDPARIYVYAQRETPTRSRLMLCDGAPVAKIKRGTFFAINVAPGRHVISSKQGVPLFVAVQPGDELFVRLGWHVQVGEPPTLVFGQVPALVARNEIRFVVYVDAKNALSSAVPKTDPRPPPEWQLKRRESQSSQQ